MARFDRAIPPGGEGEVVLTLKTKGYQGFLHKSAVIYSNDPEHPQIKLAIKAQVKVPISLEPWAVLLEGFLDDDITGLVTIKAHEDHPLILEPAKLSLPKKVTYEIKTVEEGRAYQVVFRNICKKRDKYAGFITLKTNYPQKPQITIRFLGYIKGSLQFRPETINFGRVKSTLIKRQKGGKFPYQCSVMVTFNRGDNLKIEKIEINRELFEAQVNEVQAGKQYRIVVFLNPEKIPNGMINENMKIYTNLMDDHVIVIPISAQKM